MSYWSNYEIEQYDSNTDTFKQSCNCGCEFIVSVTKNPGYNNTEEYECPNCKSVYTAHCETVRVKRG